MTRFQIERVARVLDVRGFLTLGPLTWPGATRAAVETALRNFYETAGRLRLDVERLGDGTRVAFRSDASEELRERARRTATATSN